jgi:hypothetical protein
VKIGCGIFAVLVQAFKLSSYQTSLSNHPNFPPSMSPLAWLLN